jgi:long-chain acyl-CoA synthetase
MAGQDVLDLGAVDVLPAGDDHVLLAVDDVQEALVVGADQPVAVYDGGRLTYRELDRASDRLAAALAAARIKPGDPVALQLPNIPQFLISYFGILKAGGAVVPLNVLLKAPEVAFHLGDSGARLLITWEGVLAEALKGAEAAGLDQIYAVGHADGSDGVAPFERLLDVIVPHFEMVTRQPTDTAVIVYTSGTTGRPKGAELTHIQLYMNGLLQMPAGLPVPVRAA